MLEAKREEFWKLVARGATVKQVVTGFGFTEGPVFSRRGYLLFSDIPSQRILRWERSALSVLRENTNRGNGLTFDHQGRLLICEGGGRVIRIEKNGATTVLVDGMKSPNDLVYAIDGSVYFSDLPAGRVYQITRERSGVGGAPPRGEVRPVAEDCEAPNGVALGPDQSRLYVADTKKSVVRVYEIAGDGRLESGRDFAPARGDGLKTDEGGNVWVAVREGVTVFNAAGQELGTVKTMEGPSNLAWGEGFRGLYITAQTSVYHVATLVSGTRTY